ncbi:hypothetical protein V1514DRAFT_329843 [Lipomyces japonicus]|uniref:uncharacterized protein n=1 Tax=Lipomyces japonicus TaxID=56871 RepID=UPI0034CF3CA2
MADLGNVLEVITRGSESFVRQYYNALDNNRTSISAFYEPNAPIVFNGNPLMGGQAYQDLYLKMPVTAHDYGSFDCHPLAAGHNGQPSIALTASGRVRIGTDKTKSPCGFSESFILRPQADGKFYVGTSCYRLVFKPDDVDIEP